MPTLFRKMIDPVVAHRRARAFARDARFPRITAAGATFGPWEEGYACLDGLLADATTGDGHAREVLAALADALDRFPRACDACGAPLHGAYLEDGGHALCGAECPALARRAA